LGPLRSFPGIRELKEEAIFVRRRNFVLEKRVVIAQEFLQQAADGTFGTLSELRLPQKRPEDGSPIHRRRHAVKSQFVFMQRITPRELRSRLGFEAAKKRTGKKIGVVRTSRDNTRPRRFFEGHKITPVEARRRNKGLKG